MLVASSYTSINHKHNTEVLQRLASKLVFPLVPATLKRSSSDMYILLRAHNVYRSNDPVYNGIYNQTEWATRTGDTALYTPSPDSPSQTTVYCKLVFRWQDGVFMKDDVLTSQQALRTDIPPTRTVLNDPIMRNSLLVRYHSYQLPWLRASAAMQC